MNDYFLKIFHASSQARSGLVRISVRMKMSFLALRSYNLYTHKHTQPSYTKNKHTLEQTHAQTNTQTHK